MASAGARRGGLVQGRDRGPAAGAQVQVPEIVQVLLIGARGLATKHIPVWKEGPSICMCYLFTAKRELFSIQEAGRS